MMGANGVMRFASRTLPFRTDRANGPWNMLLRSFRATLWATDFRDDYL